jgi:endonuclease/exonuclease/phosphatase family metal-dependent hydrolase
MKNSLVRFASLFLWFVAVVMISWYVLHLTRGDSLLPVRMLTYVNPWLTIAALLSALCAWYGQRFKLAVTLSCLFLLFAYPYMPQFLPSSVEAGSEPSFKVMSYSVMGRNHDYEAMAKVYAEHHPDLAFFQEVGKGALEEKIRALSVHEQLYFVPTNNVGFIVSRYPLNLAEETRPFSRFILTLPEGDVSLWNVHTTKALRSYEQQFKQVKALTDAIKQAKGPLIVAGDFNATEMSETYRIMAEPLKNAHAEAGFGFGFTFPSRARRLGTFLPFLRIDHIFYSEHFQALDCTVGDDAGGSDHFPVIATLQLKR